MGRSLVSHIMAAAGAALFPPTCPLCRAATGEAHAVCSRCWTGLRFIERPYCERLGTPFGVEQGPGAISPEAIAAPPRFDRMRAALLYDDAAGRIVSGLKYGDRTELAPLMAGWMARAGAELLGEADLVVPVPLHRFRLLRRRFNQSAELARRIAKHGERPYAPLVLQRRKRTRRQVGLGAPQRRENVRNAFAVPEKAKPQLAGKRVLLIDDVFTTGATIDAATLALLRAGAAKVDILVFARVAGRA